MGRSEQRLDAPEAVLLLAFGPLDDVYELDLNVTPRTAGLPCGTLVAAIRAEDPIGPLLFINHFLHWQLSFEHERELQTVAAVRFVGPGITRDHVPRVSINASSCELEDGCPKTHAYAC